MEKESCKRKFGRFELCDFATPLPILLRVRPVLVSAAGKALNFEKSRRAGRQDVAMPLGMSSAEQCKA